jgi:hypothetical protein
MYLDNDPGVLISACLATALARRCCRAGLTPQAGRSREGDSIVALMLSRRCAEVRAAHAAQHPDRGSALAVDHAQQVLGTVSGPVLPGQRLIFAHAGGRDVASWRWSRRLELAPGDLRYSAAMLREYGNLSVQRLVSISCCRPRCSAPAAGGGCRPWRRLQLPRRLASAARMMTLPRIVAVEHLTDWPSDPSTCAAPRPPAHPLFHGTRHHVAGAPAPAGPRPAQPPLRLLELAVKICSLMLARCPPRWPAVITLLDRQNLRRTPLRRL